MRAVVGGGQPAARQRPAVARHKEPDYEQSEAILWESIGSRKLPLPRPHDPISSCSPPALCLLES